jgi:DNA-binding response OmpR family regulator
MMNTRRVLVVEDDSAIRRGIADALQFSGYEVIQSPNGEEVQAEIDVAADRAAAAPFLTLEEARGYVYAN